VTNSQGADELWAWIQPALQQLREADQDLPLAELFAEFLNQLGINEATDHPVTMALAEHLETLPDDERLPFLRSAEAESYLYQLVQSQPAEDEGYDEAAWQAFLAENGSHWDGTEGSWDQFREWFLYAAAQQGFGTPTTALVSYLDGLTVEGRVETLTQYGVAVGV
jgi:hypothetical protein